MLAFIDADVYCQSTMSTTELFLCCCEDTATLVANDYTDTEEIQVTEVTDQLGTYCITIVNHKLTAQTFVTKKVD